MGNTDAYERLEEKLLAVIINLCYGVAALLVGAVGLRRRHRARKSPAENRQGWGVFGGKRPTFFFAEYAAEDQGLPLPVG